MEKFEAVVVGAGIAGLAAAYELARNGVQVLVLERGKSPGQKNVTGGILYGQSDSPYNLDYLFPDFAKTAPVERRITKSFMHNIAGDQVKTVDTTPLHEYKTKWAYSLLRGAFDRWFGDQVHKAAEKNGGGVLCNVRVKGPLMENGRIVGVLCEELDEIRADLIIAADGATSDLTRAAGLRGWGRPDTWFQGVKVVVKMPTADIEKQFGVKGDEGTAHLFAGDVFGGTRGGGFLYTNKDTLSIGTVFHLDSVAAKKTEPHRHLDRLIKHPIVANMLGGKYEELEYSAKLIPDGKKMALRSPYRDNLLAIGDAAGQMKAAGPIIKGMNLGVTSGILAAQAYLKAKKDNRLNEAGSNYASALQASYVGRELFNSGGGFMKGIFSFGPTKAIAEWGAVNTGMGMNRAIAGMNDYALASIAPDDDFTYLTLPVRIAQKMGQKVSAQAATPKTRTTDERIAALTYDTDIGREHIQLTDSSVNASGRAVMTCPVSASDSSRGCYRIETVVDPSGKEVTKVVLDTQPCVECGTCALMAATTWHTPRGGKGVGYQYG
ncbi:MAG: FAD-dependent oxidoreductase [Dehalococcoidia bacterium]|nr:FAD-dependent oxidoreductase [Dehalococcoidia bacterium]